MSEAEKLPDTYSLSYAEAVHSKCVQPDVLISAGSFEHVNVSWAKFIA